MRGEYGAFFIAHALLLELPPRARRIRDPLTLDPDKDGTTSACAENTMLLDEIYRLIGNYLRVRGEYRSHAGHHLQG